ncbi:DUF5522 domain-containing protein [Hymenobacter sp. BT770]|uniref:DUF5522 domain-containing protein n=1 Tax=Hymenobacter sp. BT770 TaxID=2886942 RepID=UPI001D128C82|nr:DUF5522 domain-containing protein [Hymenobacter sp. BT770]MCC3153785.1 DUF5522 domain-containing protein [Hymenobacter sp. BT770]MDO3416919.1 DUF5522 domain-containing protein [Hymenobacter sp. BT770]
MPAPVPQPLQPGDFYYTPEGYLVFTEQYHRRRGSCCQSGCRHCPWKFRAKAGSQGASDQK